MTPLETLAVALVRLLPLTRARGFGVSAASGTAYALAHQRAREVVPLAIRVAGSRDVRVLRTIGNGWSNETTIVAALALLGEMMSEPAVDDGPPTPRDPDDTAAEAP